MRFPLAVLALTLALPASAEIVSRELTWDVDGVPMRGHIVHDDAQASRGGQWYAAACESCHPTRDMSSTDFKARWGGMRALDLYAIISTQMPQNEPGSLTRRTYADIVAYLMQLNGIPAGTSLLTADSTVLAATRLSFGTAPTGK